MMKQFKKEIDAIEDETGDEEIQTKKNSTGTVTSGSSQGRCSAKTTEGRMSIKPEPGTK